MKAILVFALFFLLPFSLKSQSYTFQRTEDGGSCFSYYITDDNNQRVTLRGDVQSSLKCPSMVGLRKNILITIIKKDLIWYDINTREKSRLTKIPTNLDGISGPVWSPDGKTIMIMLVDQERKNGFADICRILILEFNASGSVTFSLEVDAPVNFSCGSLCSGIPESDFRFIDNKTIEYRRHELIEERPGELERVVFK